LIRGNKQLLRFDENHLKMSILKADLFESSCIANQIEQCCNHAQNAKSCLNQTNFIDAAPFQSFASLTHASCSVNGKAATAAGGCSTLLGGDATACFFAGGGCSSSTVTFCAS
jgi:hypothetical protein